MSVITVAVSTIPTSKEDANLFSYLAHLLGNVYVKFRHEEDAQKALSNLAGRFYAGKPIIAEFSPVTG